jgi:Outer membrane protein beta-barrel domain
MRIASYVVVGVMLLALTPAVGSAQEKRFHVNFGGGPTFNFGDIGEHFSTGWGPAIGITIDGPNNRLGFQFEYGYRWFPVDDDLPIGATRFSANHSTQQLDFNLVVNITRPDSPVRLYAVAGPGAYYRNVEITEYVGNGVICGWYVCGTYPVDAVIGSRGGWDFGFNVGGGVGFGIGESSEFYIETRYHYVGGPEIEEAAPLPAGTTATGGSTNGNYMPLTFGFRF